jgi:hypothetical protein
MNEAQNSNPSTTKKKKKNLVTRKGKGKIKEASKIFPPLVIFHPTTPPELPGYV